MVVKRVRQASVAGYFYPQDPEALRQELSRCTSRLQAQGARLQAAPSSLQPRASSVLPVSGVIVPHAGFQYSGSVAGETFSRVSIPRRCVVLGPNHTGCGATWSLMAEGAYATPLGEVAIDGPLARALLHACPMLAEDHLAHKAEHAIEAELPFLQWLGPAELSIVPLVIGSEDPEECQQAASAIAHVIRGAGEPVLLVASSDFSHYEPQATASHKDSQVIEAILALDAARFLQRVREASVAMCGAGPVACVVSAARELGATSATLVRYATSAEAGGDPQSVVGYAGIILN